MHATRRRLAATARFGSIIGAAGLVLAAAGSLQAQEPPAPPKPGSLLAPKAAPAPPPPRWSGEGSVSYVQTTGNSENQTLGAGFKLLHQPLPWKFELRSAFIRTESGDVKSAERLNALLRGERSLGDGLAVYGQASFLRDLFAGISAQKSIEAGLLYKLFESDRQLLTVSAALGYTGESRVSPAPGRDFLGGRTALSYRRKLGAASEFSNDVDYMANFKQSSDWRVTNVAGLSASVSKVLAVKLAHQLYYFHDAVPGKKGTDTTFLASLVVRWPQ